MGLRQAGKNQLLTDEAPVEAWSVAKLRQGFVWQALFISLTDEAPGRSAVSRQITSRELHTGLRSASPNRLPFR